MPAKSIPSSIPEFLMTDRPAWSVVICCWRDVSQIIVGVEIWDGWV